MAVYRVRIAVSFPSVWINDDLHRRICSAPISAVVPNDQIQADVEQLMDLMKTRKQHLEDILKEKMQDFKLICALENVRL